MEDIMKQSMVEAIRQVPSLVVLAVVVWMFVKIIFRFIKHIEDRGHIIENLHKEHMDERKISREVLVGVTNAITALTVAVDRFKNHDA